MKLLLYDSISHTSLKLNKDHGGKKVDSIIYKQIVGSLMYLTATRPDIMHSVSLISRYMENPTELHFFSCQENLSLLARN